MSPKILTLIAYLAAAAGIVLELCGVPGAGLVLGTVAGWLGARRPGDGPVLGPVLEQLEPPPTFPAARKNSPTVERELRAIADLAIIDRARRAAAVEAAVEAAV